MAEIVSCPECLRKAGGFLVHPRDLYVNRKGYPMESPDDRSVLVRTPVTTTERERFELGGRRAIRYVVPGEECLLGYEAGYDGGHVVVVRPSVRVDGKTKPGVSLFACKLHGEIVLRHPVDGSHHDLLEWQRREIDAWREKIPGALLGYFVSVGVDAAISRVDGGPRVTCDIRGIDQLIKACLRWRVSI